MARSHNSIFACALFTAACRGGAGAVAVDAGPSVVEPHDGGVDSAPPPYEESACSTSPVRSLPAFKSVSAGRRHTCALGEDGAVLCWGANDEGQLGNGSAVELHTPSPVCGIGPVSAIAVGANHACALTTAAEVVCWGSNTFDQLGNPTAGTYSPLPVAVVGLLAGTKAIAVGEAHSCAISGDGVVQCWGATTDGTFGSDESTSKSALPKAVPSLDAQVVSLVGGSGHSCALVQDGRIECWGQNNYGQLGDGTFTNRAVPAAVTAHARFRGLTSGALYSCGLEADAEKPDGGGVWCWGYNVVGQLGDGTTTNRALAVPVVGLTSGVSAIAAGNGHACALMSSGGVQCWGSGAMGQLGHQAFADSLVPVSAADIESGMEAIAAGGNHTCALSKTGSITCWGANENGQLGNGFTSNAATPVEVASAR